MLIASVMQFKVAEQRTKQGNKKKETEKTQMELIIIGKAGYWQY
jgi:hypothetical protein